MCCLAHRGSTAVFRLLNFTISCLAPMDFNGWTTYCICESSFLIHLGDYHNLFVSLNDSLTS